ncbi:NitT/TauT family transport system substrate-binding protein [Amorphus suaedae]
MMWGQSDLHGVGRGTVGRRVASIAVVLSVAGILGTDAALAQSGNTINVAIQPTTTALPLVVADKAGIFTDNGISVKWTVSNVPISDSIAALGRQFEVAMGTQPALIAAAGQGIPVVVITGGALDTAENETSDIVAGADSGITDFDQLAGKTVGTLTLTGNIHFSMLNLLEERGVDPNSINWVIGTVPQLPDLLKAGRVDAIEEIEPFASAAVAAGGISLGDPFRSIGDRAYVGMFVASRDWANDNKDAVLSFNKSLQQAAEWITKNPAEAKNILGSYTGLKGPILEKMPIPDFHFSETAADLGKEQRKDLQTWLDILARTSDFRPVEVGVMLPGWVE